MAVAPESVRAVVKAACCLHNMLQDQSTPAEVAQILQEELGEPEGLQDLQAMGNRAGRDAARVRNLFKEYFLNYSPLSWQNAHIARGSFA